MEDFEGDGVFWMPDNVDMRVAGRLTYDSANGANLSLIGALSNHDQMFSGNTVPARTIHGFADGRELTLIGCFVTNTRWQMPGLNTEKFRVGQILSGAYFEEATDLAFDGVSIELDQLTHWVGKTGITMQMRSAGAQSIDGMTVEYNQIPEELALWNEGEIKIGYGWGASGDNFVTTTISHRAFLTLNYNDRQPLSKILMDLNSIQDLVTLAVHAPAAPTNIELYRDDLVLGQEGGSFRKPISLGTENAAQLVREDRPQSWPNMYFLLRDIGGVSTIGRWIEMARRYRPVLGALLSLRYSARLYQENRYLNVMSAAESFHRLRFSNEVEPKSVAKARNKKIGKVIKATMGAETSRWVSGQLAFSNEPRLRRRLEELADFVGAPLGNLVGDVAAWCQVVTATRNRMTHEEEGIVDVTIPGDVYWLAESVYFLVMLCLFRECGVPDEVLVKSCETQSYIILKMSIDDAVLRCGKSFVKGWRGAADTP